MRDESKIGGGMRDTGCGIKILRRERDLIILGCGHRGMRDSFKIDGEMRDEKQKITRDGRYAENCNFNQTGSG